jgi:hypothetical protein
MPKGHVRERGARTKSRSCLSSAVQSVRKILVDLQSLARGPTGKRRLPSLSLAAVTSVAKVAPSTIRQHPTRTVSTASAPHALLHTFSSPYASIHSQN